MIRRTKAMTAGNASAKAAKRPFPREPTIAAAFARGLIEVAAARGADSGALMARAGVAPGTLDDPDARVALARYMALMRAGQELANDPALALHFGEAFDMAELSIVGLLGQASENVLDAFSQLGRFMNLVVDVEVDDPEGRRLVLSQEGGEWWLIDTRSNPNALPEITESAMARMAAAKRRPPGMPPVVREVHVTHEPPAHRDEYARVFDVPVFFGSRRNALLFAGDDWMHIKPPNPSRYAFGVLSVRAEALLKSLESATTARGRVESLLMPVLHTGTASMDTIAAKLGMSRQTLFRKLKAEGITFEKVLDELRHKMALNYLGDRKVSVTETAYLVGFSDPASFSRAFKRWTGASPKKRAG